MLPEPSLMQHHGCLCAWIEDFLGVTQCEATLFQLLSFRLPGITVGVHLVSIWGARQQELLGAI